MPPVDTSVLHAGFPKEGHVAQRNASPLEQLPHAETFCAASAVERITACPDSSISFLPQEQFLQALFLVSHPASADDDEEEEDEDFFGSRVSAAKSASSSTKSPESPAAAATAQDAGTTCTTDAETFTAALEEEEEVVEEDVVFFFPNVNFEPLVGAAVQEGLSYLPTVVADATNPANTAAELLPDAEEDDVSSTI